MKDVIEKIKELRKKKKLTLAEVGEVLEINASAYHKVELGQTPLTLDRLEKLAKLFNVQVVDFLGYEYDAGSSKPQPQLEALEQKVKDLQKELAEIRESRDMYKNQWSAVEELVKQYVAQLPEEEQKKFKGKTTTAILVIMIVAFIGALPKIEIPNNTKSTSKLLSPEFKSYEDGGPNLEDFMDE